MKSADIPDGAFLGAVSKAAWLRRQPGARWGSPTYSHATRWDVAAVLVGRDDLVLTGESMSDYDERMPQKLILAKARKLIRRGLLDGCHCGCRGDFEVTPTGQQPPPTALPTSPAEDAAARQKGLTK